MKKREFAKWHNRIWAVILECPGHFFCSSDFPLFLLKKKIQEDEENCQ